MPKVLRARRVNHWASSVRPLHGPRGLLWLEADGRLLGLDAASGERRVEQSLRPGPSDPYGVSTERWPYLVHAASAPPVVAKLTAGAVAVARGHVEVARAPLPDGFAETSRLAQDDRSAWLVHAPSRGPERTRVARFDLETHRFGATHELGFAADEIAVGGGRLAAFDARRGQVHVLGPSGLVGVVTHTPSAMWGGVALDGDQLAVVAHQPSAQPGAVAAVGWAEVREGETPAVRQFAVQTQGASAVTFVDGALALHQYGDVTLIALGDLRAAPPGELRLAIEDVPAPPPGGAETARVTFFGATTGFGFVESARHGRLRFQADAEHPVAVGDEIVLDAVEGAAVQRWHRSNAGAAPLALDSRCFVPVVWSDFVERVRAPAAPAAPAPVPSEAAYCTSVWYGAELQDPEAEEAPITDHDALRALDGTLERSEELIDYLDDEGDDAGLVSVRPTLRFVEGAGALRLAVELYTRRLPSDAELARFEGAVERLLDSAWGLNHEFEPPAGYHGCVVALTYEPFGVTVRSLE
ncbi:MAG: hypothetical protein KF729_28595 [Sandaracinaceae bacterium]|nr:hypothetical protein [Sandaracinaceae bacterium]